jgi:ABC-type Zn uptake system ZnuABC Zn-binding protein ZnuA
MSRTKFTITWFVTWLVVIGWCVGGAHAAAPPKASPDLKVLAIETFLADIAQNVAGERLTVESLIPIGLDPHSFEPTPGDVRRVAESQVLILHGAGMEEFLAPILEQAGGEQQIIEAAAGLAFRTPPAADSDLHEHGDPHFWLDPTRVITYVVNIRDGLSTADPDGAPEYARNAAAYISQLEALDRWITEQVQQIPPERRLLVTNHESFGYFADRYGFQVVGTIIPSVSTGASPSAQQMAQLIEHIRETGAPAIFLETGTNPQLAEQIAADAGVKVVTELFTHSITEPDGVAPTYIAMMEYNTRAIVEALK